jgi:hypothetical protein
LGAVFAEAQPEVVFHLAAQIDVRYSVAHPAGDADANVLGTIAVLEAARACGARRVVNTSTGGGLYGDADVIPTPEDHPIRPLAPYDRRSTPPRDIARCTRGCTGCPPCRCVMEKSMGHARTSMARPVWWRSSAAV